MQQQADVRLPRLKLLHHNLRKAQRAPQSQSLPLTKVAQRLRGKRARHGVVTPSRTLAVPCFAFSLMARLTLFGVLRLLLLSRSRRHCNQAACSSALQTKDASTQSQTTVATRFSCSL